MSEFSDLETLQDLDESTSRETRQKFPCQACAGTGIKRGGYVNPWEGKCYTCNGKGYFLTSPHQRQKAKKARTEKKASALQVKIDAFTAEHEDLMKYLTANASWSDFCSSLVNGITTYGSLTENQLAAAYRSMAKHQEKQAEKAQAEKNAPVLDLTRINELFDTAKDNGLKKPRLRIGDLAISLAPASGKNAGYLYVKVDGSYAGKISPEGKLMATRNAPSDLQETLEAIAQDPRGKMTEHGRITGSCSCCGRELTNKDSIQAGIGPICAENFGI